MTRALVALALLLLPPCGCGKYGRPVRTGDATTVTAPHPADCEDPEHEHEHENEEGPE